jgi:hypothetical protein
VPDLTSYVKAAVPYLDKASVVLILIAFVVSLLRETKADLRTHLLRAGSAAGIPYALFLVCGALDPSLVNGVSGMNLPFVFGGLALLYVSFLGATK